MLKHRLGYLELVAAAPVPLAHGHQHLCPAEPHRLRRNHPRLTQTCRGLSGESWGGGIGDSSRSGLAGQTTGGQHWAETSPPSTAWSGAGPLLEPRLPPSEASLGCGVTRGQGGRWEPPEGWEQPRDVPNTRGAAPRDTTPPHNPPPHQAAGSPTGRNGHPLHPGRSPAGSAADPTG